MEAAQKIPIDKHNCQSRESYSLEQALERVSSVDRWISAIIARLEPILPSRRPLKVLDLGCAQGQAVIALRRRGYEAYGVEPWGQACETAKQLAVLAGVEIEVRQGTAEEIPFEDGTFDLVLATSVMEHVVDLDLSLREIYRVLRPGGVFWFQSASAMCPRQREIRGFPLFGWYPNRLKRKIMMWAKDHKPELVGFTQTPAINWWTPWMAQHKLRQAGFSEIWDRWDLRRVEETSGPTKMILLLARKVKPVRWLGDMAIPECSYAGKKAG